MFAKQRRCLHTDFFRSVCRYWYRNQNNRNWKCYSWSSYLNPNRNCSSGLSPQRCRARTVWCSEHWDNIERKYKLCDCHETSVRRIPQYSERHCRCIAIRLCRWIWCDTCSHRSRRVWNRKWLAAVGTQVWQRYGTARADNRTGTSTRWTSFRSLQTHWVVKYIWRMENREKRQLGGRRTTD